MNRNLVALVLFAAVLLAVPPRAQGAEDGLTKNEKAWFEAARRGDAKGLEALLGELPIDAQDCEGNTALMLAVKGGHVPAVSLLVDHRADANRATCKGATPLGLAVFRSKVDLVKLLLMGGAKADQRGLMDGTPLLRAARAGNIEIVTLLLDAGAGVNETNRIGMTPLHGAASDGNTAVVKLLLKRGADPALKTAQGQTALDLARKAGKKETAAALDAAGNPPDGQGQPPGASEPKVPGQGGRVIELAPNTKPPAAQGR
jgi:uncharacterized protein